MAIKKVRRPVLNRPSENNNRLEQEQTENEVNSNGKEEPSMNQLNTINHHNQSEVTPNQVLLPKKHQH